MKREEKPVLAVVLGIRPDVIRAAQIINKLRARDELNVVFIWSGQHYSENLKDVFFRELGVAAPEIELGAVGETDAEVSSDVIRKLYPVLQELNPAATVFLGDTNTVMGCLASAQLNIPIVHIEGCMRSYDWRMPEEKCRTVIDHLSDVIYTYFPEYKEQGIREGLNPDSIVVVQNLIVDILDEYYFKAKSRLQEISTENFFTEREIERGKYLLATCHRRENVEDKEALSAIFNLFSASPYKIFFPASYRTQKRIMDFGLQVPTNVKLVDPIGYEEMLVLMTESYGVITDSGTVVEETAVLGVPSIQMRKATERPQVYDCGSSVKFDPSLPNDYPAAMIYKKLDTIKEKSWDHGLGDGKASDRIVEDLVSRALREDGFKMHLPINTHHDISRSYRSDGIEE